jgi:integrase
MAAVAKGHVEQLPSGSWRAVVYAGTDPLTGKAIYLKATAKTAAGAQVELARLLERAATGQKPESDATVAVLLERYMTIAELDLSTRESYEGYIRRTIVPALGRMKLRKLRGPILDTFYARLRRCGDPVCTGRPFVEHRNVPVLTVDPGDPRPGWRQIADTIADAVAAGRLAPGEQLPSVREIAACQSLRTATLQQAFAVLAAESVITVRQGRTAVVTGPADAVASGSRPHTRPATGHDCARAGCRQHTCRPMTAKTVRNIHSILSGAFAAAVRWEWIDRNPAESAKLPKTQHRPPPATSPADVAKVIAAARESHPALSVYLWLAAITGARRGELCGLQWADVDLDDGVLHIAFGYIVRGGQRIRKDTKTHQDRRLAIDEVTCAMLSEFKQRADDLLAGVGLMLSPAAYVFSNDPSGGTAWNPDWATHKVAKLADAAGVNLNIKALRHYTASQLLAGGIDLRNTAARLGHGSGGATTLRHYADPVSEVDRRAAAYLASLTALQPSSAAASHRQ